MASASSPPPPRLTPSPRALSIAPGGPRRGPGLLAAFLASFLAPATFALDPTKAITRYGHEVWTSRNGLPGEAVYEVLQTQDGYLWLRTSSGLVRFDGVRFTWIEPPEPFRDSARAICKSTEGDLQFRGWAKTLRLKDGLFSHYLTPASLPEGAFRLLYETRGRQLWIGTDNVLYLARDGVPARVLSATGLVSAFFEDHQNRLWIGTNSGLFGYRDGEVLVYPSGFHATLLQAAKWLRTRTLPNSRVKGEVTALSDNSILSLSEDREGSLWVGTRSRLDRLRDTKMTSFTTKEGLAHDATKSMLEARDGSLLITSEGGGLTRLQNGVATVYTTKNRLASNSVGPLFESRDGSIWIGSLHGLSRVKDGTIATYSAGGKLSNIYVSAINEDDESLIIATSETLVRRVKNGALTDYTIQGEPTPLSRPGNYVATVYRDPSGTTWFGTMQGLYKFSKGQPPGDAHASQISSPVFTIHDDLKGDLWLTGAIPGLTRFRTRDGHVTRYTTQEGLFHDEIGRVLSDREEELAARRHVRLVASIMHLASECRAAERFCPPRCPPATARVRCPIRASSSALLELATTSQTTP